MLPSFLQRHVGIGAQGDPFLLVHKAVFQPPPLAVAGGDFQIQATSVKHFSGFIAGFSMTDSGVGEGHWGHLLVLTADLSPILPLVVKGYYWASLDDNKVLNGIPWMGLDKHLVALPPLYREPTQYSVSRMPVYRTATPRPPTGVRITSSPASIGVPAGTADMAPPQAPEESRE